MINARQIAPNSIEIELLGVSMVVEGRLSTMPLETRKAIIRTLLTTLIELEGESDEVQILWRELAE